MKKSGTPQGQLATSIVNTGIHAGVAKKVATISKHLYKTSIKYVGIQKFEYFKYSRKFISISRKMGKISGTAGLLSVALTGLQMYSNISYYGWGEGLGRSGIDILGLATGAGIGVGLVAVGAGTATGVIVCTVGSVIIGGLANEAKKIIFE
ncbi:hypothetical protein [Clostridium ganghwense]|uniref:Bacteriocin n=1 Tax=Clostridium ganghwense TaxID=312089 RepID=A0ABT4CNI8_9CLOT|nr:hypothetical protein [Clostridium ganghwense]MCY6370627.1 hypothetical protein [Clostridium ganghwense]